MVRKKTHCLSGGKGDKMDLIGKKRKGGLLKGENGKLRTFS